MWVHVSEFVRQTSQTTRSTKLSYAPDMQRVVYHGFCSRASLGSARSSRAAIGGLANRSSSFVSNVLPQIRREPFFHCGYRVVAPGRVINCLIAADLPYSEIFR